MLDNYFLIKGYVVGLGIKDQQDWLDIETESGIITVYLTSDVSRAIEKEYMKDEDCRIKVEGYLEPKSMNGIDICLPQITKYMILED